MSESHKQYLESLKRYRLKIKFFRILVFLVFMTLWEAAANLGWIDSFFSAPPPVLSNASARWEKPESSLPISAIRLQRRC